MITHQSSAVKPIPHACAEPYHRAVAAMDSCFGLVRPHHQFLRRFTQHNLQIYLSEKKIGG